MNIIVPENKYIAPGLYTVEQIAEYMAFLVELIRNGERSV